MTTLATDAFTRADAANLGGNWTNKRNSPGVVSNQMDIGTGGDANNAYYNAATFPADQWAQLTVVVTPSGSNQVGAGCRLVQDSSQGGYWGGFDGWNSGDANRRLWKFVSTTWTSLASEAVNVAASDILRLEVQGTTVRLLVNGIEELSTTDASHSSGPAGVTAAHSAGNVALADDWSAGNFLLDIPTQRSGERDPRKTMLSQQDDDFAHIGNIRGWFRTLLGELFPRGA